MTTTTLADVQAAQQKLADMIDELVRTSTTVYALPATSVELRSGERYAGLVLSQDGKPSHHLVLLAGDAEGVTFDAATQWATDVGGELPTRQEQALLFANLKSEFQSAWYWSSQPHETNGSFAWNQLFDLGTQYGNRKSYEGRARAVRRFAA